MATREELNKKLNEITASISGLSIGEINTLLQAVQQQVNNSLIRFTPDEIPQPEEEKKDKKK